MSSRNVTTRRSAQPPLPLKRVHVELTNTCNFTCEYCPNPVMVRPKGNMDTALLASILEEAAAVKLARTVLFHQQGEPTLHRGLADGVRRCSQLGLRSCVATNGSLLTDGLVDDLIDARLSQLVISLQTPEEASYALRGATHMPWNDFERRVVNAVRRVRAARATTHVTLSLLTRPSLRWSAPGRRARAVVARDADLRALLRNWASRLLDGNEIPASARALASAAVNQQCEFQIAPRLAFEVRPVLDWAMPAHPPGRAWYPASIGRCHSQGLTDHVAILWNGQYSFCCADHDGQTSQARFQDTSLLDFLDSASVQAAIGGFKHRRPINPCCRLCLGGPSLSHALLKSVGAAAWFRLFDRRCCAMDAAPTTVSEPESSIRHN